MRQFVNFTTVHGIVLLSCLLKPSEWEPMKFEDTRP